MFGRFGESFVELLDVMVFQKAIGLFFGLDPVALEFIWEPALKRLIHPFTSSSGLGRIRRNHPDA